MKNAAFGRRFFACREAPLLQRHAPRLRGRGRGAAFPRHFPQIFSATNAPHRRATSLSLRQRREICSTAPSKLQDPHPSPRHLCRKMAAIMQVCSVFRCDSRFFHGFCRMSRPLCMESLQKCNAGFETCAAFLFDSLSKSTNRLCELHKSTLAFPAKRSIM